MTYTEDDLPIRLPVTAGALMRRQLRAFLDLNGLAYTEYKGWLESDFVITVADRDQAEAWNVLHNLYGSEDAS